MNILAVSTTGMGDSLLATPGLSLLRSSFPEATIELLTHKRWTDLFRYNPHINAYHGYSNNVLTRACLRYRLRKYWDYIVVFHANVSVYALLEKLSFGKAINNQGYSRPHKNIVAIEDSYAGHIVDRRNAVARAIGAKGEAGKTLELFLDPETVKRSYSKPRIMLQPAAANEFKMWPTERFAELVTRLNEAYDVDFFVVGGAADGAFYDKIKSANGGAHIVNATGRGLYENCALIDTADLFVTNDTGLMHVAYALRRPTLSLWCLTDYEAYGPYNGGDCFKYIKVDPPGPIAARKEDRTNEGMLQISVDEVFAKSVELLNMGM